jgi:hypothetical protein
VVPHGISNMTNLSIACANVRVPHGILDMSNLTNMFVINVSVPHDLSNMTNLIVVTICMITWN